MDPGDIEKLAHLARLDISADTVEQTATSIAEVLALVDQLQAADTNQVQPLAHPLDATQVLREDAISEIDIRDTLLQNAPATERGLFLVPKVIE